MVNYKSIWWSVEEWQYLRCRTQSRQYPGNCDHYFASMFLEVEWLQNSVEPVGEKEAMESISLMFAWNEQIGIRSKQMRCENWKQKNYCVEAFELNADYWHCHLFDVWYPQERLVEWGRTKMSIDIRIWKSRGGRSRGCRNRYNVDITEICDDIEWHVAENLFHLALRIRTLKLVKISPFIACELLWTQQGAVWRQNWSNNVKFAVPRNSIKFSSFKIILCQIIVVVTHPSFIFGDNRCMIFYSQIRLIFAASVSWKQAA